MGLIPSVESELAFTPPSHVLPDPERRGLLRCRAIPWEQIYAPENYDRHRCRLLDWAEPGVPAPRLLLHGFEGVDLSGVEGLAPVLERVRDAGEVGDADIREIRRRLTGSTLPLADGSKLRLLTIAREGFIMRVAGPNGMALGPEFSAHNGHDAAAGVHADQDVLGTPLRQLMRGAAPWLFRHEAPDSHNRWSPLCLLNLWLPLRQITRPLVLMDQRSLDRRAHQLRYGLPTDAFLDRDAEQRVNDIWHFLHDAGQRWYFHSDLPLGSAYLFHTLGTPHGSCVLPGEEQIERCARALRAGVEAVRGGSEAGLRAALDTAKAEAAPEGPLPLQRATEAMGALLDEARREAEALWRPPLSEAAQDWCQRAGRAVDSVTRKSIEMRVVALRVPALGRRRADT